MLLGAFVATMPLPASSATPTRFYVTYVAPPVCPDRGSFIQLLTQRVPAAWLTNDVGSHHVVGITLEVDVEDVVARMQYVDDAGHPVMRTVRANRCDEALSGIALVTALALEAQLYGAPAVKPGVAPAMAAPSEQADASESQRVVVPIATMPQTDPSSAPTEIRSEALPSLPDPRATKPNLAFRHELALRLAVARGLGPSITPGVGPEWGFGPEPQQPLVRIAATWNESESTVPMRQDGSSARFQLLSAEAKICVGAALTNPPVLSTAACSGFEFGRYLAKGLSADRTRVKGDEFPMLWASGVASLHLRAQVAQFFVDFSPILRLPMVRREFATAPPESTVHSIPDAAFGLAVSVGAAL